MAVTVNPNVPHLPPVSSPAFVAGTPAWVQPIIDKAAKAHNIPTIILSALLKQESGFNPKATSPVGAQGIAQFMPGTAKGMNVNPWDPESAVNGAAQYLKNAYDKFGKMDLALASYNAGTGAVEKYGGVPPYKETQNYVKSIMSMAGEPHQSNNGPYLSLLDDLKSNSQPKISSAVKLPSIPTPAPTPTVPSQPDFTQANSTIDFSTPTTKPQRSPLATTDDQLRQLYNPNGGQLLSNLT